MGRIAKAKPHHLKDISLRSLIEPCKGLRSNFVGTKICATIGPSCSDVPTLIKMLEAGMSVARIDLTWGPLAYHRRSLDNLQTAMQSCKKLCGVMVDTLGRELMIKRRFVLGPDGWPKHDETLSIEAGATVTITTRQVGHCWPLARGLAASGPRAHRH